MQIAYKAKTMVISPITTEQEYEDALTEADRHFDARINTPAGDRLEMLIALIEAYER